MRQWVIVYNPWSNEVRPAHAFADGALVRPAGARFVVSSAAELVCSSVNVVLVWCSVLSPGDKGGH